ncbi:MAG: tRNA lysidine(34) synthetase TilS [Planctomycetes bacterium]|nr:tRNA lysidine(34) synthetase TilS [Planctomycetota bacterium]
MVSEHREDRAAALSGTLRRFQTTLDEGGFLAGVDHLLVAVSGGADSTALAILLHRLFCSRGAGPRTWIGHVHHGIRGGDADADEAFVVALAARLGWHCLVERVDAPAAAAGSGISIEMAARELRFEVFRRWASENELDAIALGHQAEDQQETVILRAARGAGVRGLSGIPASRDLAGAGRPARIIRPLLRWSRADLVDFLIQSGEEFRTDRTNLSLDIPRNRVRHVLLPLLEEIQPGARAGLERAARIAGEVAGDLAALADRAVAEALLDRRRHALRLDRRKLATWPPAVLREVLARLRWDLEEGSPPPSRSAAERFADLVRGADDREADLGGGWRADARYGFIDVCAPSGSTAAGDAPVRLSIGGDEVEWAGWRIGAEEAPWRGRRGDRLEEWIDARRAGGALEVRGRRAGDLFHPLGAGGSQKLKEFFRQRRIPPRRRDAHPLVVAGEEIVWVVGERIAHPWRVSAETTRTLRLWARPPPEAAAEERS